ncbi:MAG: tRNA pseudouridine(38-40) synthase TruA [Flavobacteriaceae bacterium]|nr:tRNA pseudouridine(38-40) synthase TruA [Flavobacteriaceae bacterium]
MRYFIKLAYKGTGFHGWQLQPNALSVQQVVQEALQILFKKPITILGAGRTDAGVHAAQFFAHFDTDAIVDTDDLVLRLNAILPNSVVVYNVFKVSEEAHARFDALSRTYEYRIYLGRNPFLTETAWQWHHQKLNVEAMNKAANYLFDYTDFKCFSKSKTDVKTYNCKITEAHWVKNENHLTFTITADRFLRNMVRAVVGTLTDIGLGKNKPESIKMIVESRDRQKAGFSVPAKGLFLTKIVYPKNIFM